MAVISELLYWLEQTLSETYQAGEEARPGTAALGHPASAWCCPGEVSGVLLTKPFCIRVILVVLHYFAVILGD